MPEQHHKTTPADDTVPRVNTPYGPQEGHVDTAAGGADSSPYENQPSGERREAAREPAKKSPGANEPRKE